MNASAIVRALSILMEAHGGMRSRATKAVKQSAGMYWQTVPSTLRDGANERVKKYEVFISDSKV